MKPSFINKLSLFVATSVASMAFAATTQNMKFTRDYDFVEATVNISNAFIPNGFDEESDVFVVASGVYPNGCYRWKDAKINNKTDFIHEVTATAQISQGMCIMVLVPFTREIRMGRMKSGQHTLRFMSEDGTYFEKNFAIQ